MRSTNNNRSIHDFFFFFFVTIKQTVAETRSTDSKGAGDNTDKEGSNNSGMTDTFSARFEFRCVDMGLRGSDDSSAGFNLTISELDDGVFDSNVLVSGFSSTHVDGLSILEADEAKSREFSEKDKNEESKGPATPVLEGSNDAGDSSHETEDGKVVKTARTFFLGGMMTIVIMTMMVLTVMMKFVFGMHGNEQSHKGVDK